MAYEVLNMDLYPRKAHFDYFRAMGYPYVGLTAQVEITEFLSCVKEKGLPLFLCLCYCAGRAANLVPQFRQRIRGNEIIQFDLCPTSHTVALDDGTYGYCTLDSSKPFEEYLPYAAREQEAARCRGNIEESAQEALDKLFLSTLPWLSYTALVQPVPFPADSNPRITWGKYHLSEGRVLLPVSVLCHHALVDGIHITQFYTALEQQLSAVCRLIRSQP